MPSRFHRNSIGHRRPRASVCVRDRLTALVCLNSWTSSTRLLAGVLSAVLSARASLAQSPSAAPESRSALAVMSASPDACAKLHELRLPDVRFTEMVALHDSTQRTDNVRASHCRVSGLMGAGIAFTVMLPDAWNQRLLMGGNGGFAGTINRQVLASATQGYLTVSTNTGHEATPGGGARWALNDMERQLDYGYVAVHRTVELAKSLAKAYYGKEPTYSYFNGCSNGGRQGLMEVQRYPEDFDGVIAAAPAAHFSRTSVSFLKNIQAVFPDTANFNKPIVTQANLDLVSAKVLENCDALDGVKDGVIGDPRACTFKLASVKACAGDKVADDCLTVAQRRAIARVYAPATDVDGTVVYPGQPVGGENLAGGWSAWITGRDTAAMRQLHVPSAQVMFATEGAKYMVFNDSTWDYTKYHGSFFKDGRRLAFIADADNTDIRKFAAHKGKLLIWHGWSDPALNPLATIDYVTQVEQRDADARNYVRLFLEPGVLHCGGGNGPSDAPWLTVLTDWVEKAQVPERVVASKRDRSGKVLQTRPLCAHPKRAVYKGDGSTDDEANFVCRAP